MKLQDLAIKHDYYCNESNYYSREAYSEYETFNEFFDEWFEHNVDMNLCFRWDIKAREDEEEVNTGEYSMLVCIMQQRKGKYHPIEITSVTEDDVPNIIKYLTPHLEKMKQLWTPFTL